MSYIVDSADIYMEEESEDKTDVVPEPVIPLVEEEPTPEVEPTVVLDTSSPPKVVFIVPYRDRLTHYKIFDSHMKKLLKDAPKHHLFYIHQTDKRGFNRGAMKNIGLMVLKDLYPNDYKNILLVFNDVDTIASKEGILPYSVQPGTVKHVYGFKIALGGIVAINAGDFEKINGFPNFWAWGYEDNMLQDRVVANGLRIDRTTMYAINDPHIIRLTEPGTRTINQEEFNRYLRKTKEGISSIHKLSYEIDAKTGFVNVLTFETDAVENTNFRREYDLINGPSPFFKPSSLRRRPTMGLLM